MRALVIGASGGIGQAFARALEGRGDDVVCVSRKENALDLRDPKSVEVMLGDLDGGFQMVLVATGILAAEGHAPEKSLSAIEHQAMQDVFAVNAVGTALILKHLPRLLGKEGGGLAGVLTARVGSIGDNQMGGWHSYRASKAAANMLVRGAAIELSRTHKDSIVVALHPGTVETPFTASYPSHRKMDAEESAGKLLAVLDALTPAETGRFFDYTGSEVVW